MTTRTIKVSTHTSPYGLVDGVAGSQASIEMAYPVKCLVRIAPGTRPVLVQNGSLEAMAQWIIVEVLS